ncbi:hypothetical protein [Salipiger abyssi]|uniref:hypothetical protein n=1 Tax=Salipiger abyssi TaxID=1250539 RepID=UPI001A8C1909|nr:hypothetical protein [Salipiger abyssi]MBN9889375.1 hypothetical protein [Salipiger abyssi]
MDIEELRERVNNVTASDFVSSALISALIGNLAERGVISDDDTRDIYDAALLSLEEEAAKVADEELREVYANARAIIEAPLKET